MRRVAIDDVTPAILGESATRRRLTDPLGTTAVAINWYRLAPGESLPSGLHAHLDQEEVFSVLSGVATFETLVPDADEGQFRDPSAFEADERVVREGEVIRFAPGEFQSGRNDGDDDLVLIALGAPRDSEDLRIPATCPDCDRLPLRLETAGELTFRCPACGAERVPADCPACGHDDLRVTLGDEHGPTGEGTAERDAWPTVVRCQGCGTTYDRPPVRD